MDQKKIAGPIPGIYRNFLNNGGLSVFFPIPGVYRSCHQKARGWSSVNPRCFGILADKPPVLRKSWPINPRCCCILAETKLPGYSITNSGSHSHPHPKQWTKLPGVEAMRETHAHDQQRDWENARETEKENTCYTRVSQQTLDPIHSPSKVYWISHASTLSAEVHHDHVGEEKEKGGFGERNRVIHIQPTTLFYLSGNRKYFLGWRLLSEHCTREVIQ